ncbi:hypothetical protein LSTR_LSTR001174 [Laodelphax striatellus]|uniref:Peroxisomal membrane protein PMP34 n=1 Tax=Laodelphax striatellus TaxID=195883 RepID=A0A482X1M7_LAOST|nr:hypothetical protein LSTR_LSTR001174 [Laodelphax striatellus]
MSQSKELFSYNTLVHAIAGSVGSVVGMATFFPLDTVRSRLQLDEKRESKNTLAVMMELVKEEGFFTLYRGIVPVLQSLCVSNFVYFYTFHGLKSFHGEKSRSAGKDLVLASIAGIVNVLTTTPLWVANTRLKMSGLKNKSTTYNGILDGLIKISRSEGIGALWNGTLPSLILVINPALQMATYEALKRRFKGVELTSVNYFVMAAISKAVATVLTYPLQLIQTKLRHGHNYKELHRDAGTLDLILYILRIYGPMGLYRGMEAKILQTVMTAALMFSAYEKITGFVFKILLSNSKIAH